MEKIWLACIDKLNGLLKFRPDLKEALSAALKKANFPEIQDIPQYYSFLEMMLTKIPVQRDMDYETLQFHYIVNSSPQNHLQTDEEFQQWLVDFSKDHGSFLDTTESTKHLDTFINEPSYQINDYFPGPSGWLTFNQFFARQVKPGKRPLAHPYDDNVILSPTDSTFLGSWPIDKEAALSVKGCKYLIGELLENSIFSNAFNNGIFTHCYLSVTDYHRYHLPVSGVIKEARTIPGWVKVIAKRDEKGEITTIDDIGFQFQQTRGMVVIDSPVGLVAVIPVGMGHVSSVTFTAEPGDQLTKGQEFGYFAYGGSDIIMLFEKPVTFTAEKDQHLKQGEQIAKAV